MCLLDDYIICSSSITYCLNIIHSNPLIICSCCFGDYQSQHNACFTMNYKVTIYLSLTQGSHKIFRLKFHDISMTFHDKNLNFPWHFSGNQAAWPLRRFIKSRKHMVYSRIFCNINSIIFIFHDIPWHTVNLYKIPWHSRQLSNDFPWHVGPC